MRERERARGRDDYDLAIAWAERERLRSVKGEVVIRAKDLPWEQNRQARVKQYMCSSDVIGKPVETALDGWEVFVQEVRVHSGKHRHQGGVAIYIIEGEGYSVCDGKRHDWEAGDLLLLPLRPGGVEHQHFNRQQGPPTKWIAFFNTSIFAWGAGEMVQMQQHPDFITRGDSPPVPKGDGNTGSGRDAH